MRNGLVPAVVALAVVAGCTVPAPQPSSTVVPSATPPVAGATPSRTGPEGRPFVLTEIGELDEPWAMAFLPDGQALITGRGGRLTLRAAEGRMIEVTGIPQVVHAGQGGLGDVIPAPDFAATRTILLSWAEAGDGGTSGAVVARATLAADGATAHLADLTVLWRQQPKVSGNGHYAHRLAFSPDGRHLFLTSGDRQKFDPAQDFTGNLGKIIRLNPDGTPAEDNPFADRGGVAAEVWSYGHRNPLGIAFDAAGNLWSSEMGPQGGDEFNRIRRGANYGWPKVSNGSHYGGAPIPDHAAGDGFEAPLVWWNPSVSPAGLLIYSGTLFPQWRGDAFVGALSGQALIRLDLDGTSARKGDEWDLNERIREVEQAPDGAIWLLTDSGRILRMAPA